ncbi:MAG: hypothetical protein LBT29_05775 [Flavobacteriaceae bacterium]|jgi:hypothetical protein|nr:hypothetical protein [Flavobacteriaceae bacterium]
MNLHSSTNINLQIISYKGGGFESTRYSPLLEGIGVVIPLRLCPNHDFHKICKICKIDMILIIKEIKLILLKSWFKTMRGSSPSFGGGRGRLRGQGWFPIHLQTTPPYGHPSKGGEFEMRLLLPSFGGAGVVIPPLDEAGVMKITPLAGLLPSFGGAGGG